MWRADGRRCCSVSETAIDRLIVPPVRAWPVQATTVASLRNGGCGANEEALIA
jgi:hypothetical protein